MLYEKMNTLLDICSSTKRAVQWKQVAIVKGTYPRSSEHDDNMQWIVFFADEDPSKGLAAQSLNRAAHLFLERHFPAAIVEEHTEEAEAA